MITLSDAPAAAALVANPALKECPAYLAGSSPTALALLLTTSATALSESRPGCTRWNRSSDLNTGPSTMRADSSQACTDLTGQVRSLEPYGMPRRRLLPSWSVFDFR